MADNYTVSVRIQGQNNLSAPVNQATQSLNQLNQQAQRTTSSFNGIKAAMTGAFIGIGIAGAARMVEQTYELGMESQRAGLLFQSFGAQVGNTSALLERLRVTTRGVVTDIDLMNAASSMLSMGIAQNADDVQRLIDVGVTFAQARGEDVSASLENLSMLLSNQSYLRLDTLGISSAEVRRLAEGYRAAGMDSAEAFTQAFLDVSESMMPQMAAVADATITPFQELRTNFENFAGEFGDSFAYLVNELAKGVGQMPDAIAGIFGGSGPSQDLIDAQTVAPMYAGIFGASGLSAGALSGSNITGALTAAILARETGLDAGSAGFMELLTQNAFGAAANDSRFGTDGGQAMLQQAMSVVNWFNGYMAVVEQAAVGVEEVAPMLGNRQYSTNAIQDTVAGSRSPLWASLMRNGNFSMNSLEFMLGMGGNVGGTSVYSQEQAGLARAFADDVQRTADALTNLDLPASITDPMARAADEANRMADAIQTGADALASMNLAQLFGQTDGGRMAEIDSAFATFLEAGGASQEIIDAYLLAAGMDSGTITDLSQQFETDVLPQLEGIYAQFGADAAIAARTSYEAALQQAAMDGSTAPLDLTTALGYTPYGTTGPGGYTIKPGDTPLGIAAALGIPLEQVRAQMQADSPALRIGDTLNFSGGGMIPTDFLNMDGLETAMMSAEASMANVSDDAAGLVDDFTLATTALDTNLTDIFSRARTLTVAVEVTDNEAPQWLRDMIRREWVTLSGGGFGGRSINAGRTMATQ